MLVLTIKSSIITLKDNILPIDLRERDITIHSRFTCISQQQCCLLNNFTTFLDKIMLAETPITSLEENIWPIDLFLHIKRISLPL